MAIVPEDLSIGVTPDLLLTTDPIHDQVKESAWEILGVREKPLDPTAPIKQTPNSIDLDINFAELDEHNRLTRSYERDCFNVVVENLSPNQIAYGAHLLNAAFNGELRALYISVPDAIVWETSQDNATLKLKRIIEARTGKLGSRLKLAGFENLTSAMRQNPDYFVRAIGNVLGGRAGDLELTQLDIPDDNEIEVDFYSPRSVDRGASPQTDATMRQEHIAGHPFKVVNYKLLPLPIFEAIN